MYILLNLFEGLWSWYMQVQSSYSLGEKLLSLLRDKMSMQIIKIIITFKNILCLLSHQWVKILFSFRKDLLHLCSSVWMVSLFSSTLLKCSFIPFFSEYLKLFIFFYFGKFKHYESRENSVMSPQIPITQFQHLLIYGFLSSIYR